jgi:hypothetical protein
MNQTTVVLIPALQLAQFMHLPDTLLRRNEFCQANELMIRSPKIQAERWKDRA